MIDANRIIEILEDVTMIDRRGAMNAADEIMAQIQAERDAARDAAKKFANTMAALSPLWTSEMAKAWTELFAVIDK